MDDPDRKSTRKQGVIDTVEEMHIIDIFMTLHPKAVGYTFFSSAQRRFSR